jgi:hypothetical protein
MARCPMLEGLKGRSCMATGCPREPGLREREVLCTSGRHEMCIVYRAVADVARARPHPRRPAGELVAQI